MESKSALILTPIIKATADFFRSVAVYIIHAKIYFYDLQELPNLWWSKSWQVHLSWDTRRVHHEY